jgi:hypothetical protein
MVFSGWRAAVLLVAALLVLSLLLAAVFWIGVLLAIVAAVGWLNLLLLPRLATRVRLPELVLAVGLLPVLGVAGLLLAGGGGVVAGGSVWVLGVALPRAVLWRLRRRLWHAGSRGIQLRRVRVVDVGSPG